MRKKLITWLYIDCVLTIFTGLISLLAAHPATAGPWLLLFDILAWPLDGNPGQFSQLDFALNGVLGGVMVGWGFMMMLFTKTHLTQGDVAARKSIMVAIVAWFISDSAASFVSGLPGNVVLNCGFLLMFMVPLRLLKAEEAN